MLRDALVIELLPVGRASHELYDGSLQSLSDLGLVYTVISICLQMFDLILQLYKVLFFLNQGKDSTEISGELDQ